MTHFRKSQKKTTDRGSLELNLQDFSNLSRSPYIICDYKRSAKYRFKMRNRLFWKLLVFIHLATGVQVAGGHIKRRVKRAARWALFQVCLPSDAAVKVRREMQAEERVLLVTHFTQLNTEQTGWRQTARPAAGAQQERAGWGSACVCVVHNSFSIILS